jgi:hypothetical protein
MTRRSGGTMPKDRINPGVNRTRRVLDPVRTVHSSHGVFRPSNRWRNQTGHQPDVRQRALLLAKQLPWLPQYNFARS